MKPDIACPQCNASNPAQALSCAACGQALPARQEKKTPKSPVTVGRFANVNEALLARTQLEGHGIPAFVADEAVGTLYDLGNNFLGGIRLQTRAADSEKARKLLAGR